MNNLIPSFIIILLAPTLVHLVNAQGPVVTPLSHFLNLKNTTWTMYNESSGSTSTLQFNNNTYTRTLHGANLTGLWRSGVVTEQQLQLCPGESKWMNNCLLFGLLIENGNEVLFMDQHGDRIHLLLAGNEP